MLHWSEHSTRRDWIIEAHTGEAITYKDLPLAVGWVRSYIGEDSKTVLLALPGGIVTSVIWLAALTGGHLLIPVSPDSTASELKKYIEDHTPDLLIVPDNSAVETNSKVVTYSQFKYMLSELPDTAEQTPKDGSIFLSTSGSTGAPKGIVLSVKHITTTANNIITAHKLTDSDRGLTPLPFHHVNAPVVSLMTAILCGSQLIIAPKYSTTAFWDWVKKYDPTWISLVPTMIAILSETKRPLFLNSSSLRFIRSASAPLPATLLEAFESRFHIPIIETYGISEAASTITSNPIPPAVHKAGSVGFPAGVKLRICEPGSVTPLPIGTIGEVCIRGDNVITKYEHDRSPESFSEGWFKTGDLGYYDADGYLFLTSRIKDIIIRGGENIFPREIEDSITKTPGVAEAVVVGHPDPVMGEKIVAFITAATPADASIVSKAKKYAAQSLSPYKVPDSIVLLDSLPRTHTKKINKNALRNEPAYVRLSEQPS